jgi:hypothetical protein
MPSASAPDSSPRSGPTSSPELMSSRLDVGPDDGRPSVSRVPLVDVLARPLVLCRWRKRSAAPRGRGWRAIPIWICETWRDVDVVEGDVFLVVWLSTSFALLERRRGRDGGIHCWGG